MSSVFTRYIASLDPGGEPPKAASYLELRKNLRGALVHAMKRRGLWQTSPRYLGYYGATSWKVEDVIEDLVSDCYLFIFIRKLAGLRKQLLVRDNVDGLVFRNIRNFLHNAQVKNDRLGYRIFERLRAALRRELDAERLYILANGPKIHNGTIFGFMPWADSESAVSQDLGPSVRAWNDHLMPELVTAKGKAREKVEADLGDCVVQLSSEGVETFSFADVVQPLKVDVRARRRALLLDGETAYETGANDEAELVRLVYLEPDFEEWQSFRKLDRCLDESLAKLEAQQKTRDRLIRLWKLVCDHVVGDGEKRLSNLGISEDLKIPRAAIPKLKNRLQKLVEDCRAAALSQPSVSGSIQPEDPRGAMAMHRIERLRLETGEAAKHSAQNLTALEARRDPIPQAGDVFLLDEVTSVPVEWLVVEVADSRSLLVVPMDDNPLLGSRDVAAPAGADESSIRCDVTAWFRAERFVPRLRTGRLPSEVVERVLSKRAEIEAGTLEVTDVASEIDDDPAYREWIDEIRQVRAKLSDASVSKRPQGQLLRFRPPWQGVATKAVLGVAAAALLLISLGLGAGLSKQRTRSAALEGRLAEAEEIHGELDRELAVLDRARRDLEAEVFEREEDVARLERENEHGLSRLEELQQRLSEALLPKPQIDLPFRHFRNREAIRRSEPFRDDDVLVVPRAANSIALIFEVADPRSFSRYRLEVVDEAKGGIIWQNDRLTKTVAEVSVALPTSLFSSGDYRIRIYGLQENEAETLVVYPLSLDIESF